MGFTVIMEAGPCEELAGVYDFNIDTEVKYLE